MPLRSSDQVPPSGRPAPGGPLPPPPLPPPLLSPPLLAQRLGSVVGAAHVLVDADVVAGYTTDWTRRFSGPAALVVRPGTTSEVAGVLRVCLGARVPVVVQGGNTGLVGASVPPPVGRRPLPVVLSTTRLDRIGPVDEVSCQLTAGAGATLAAVQAAARASDLAFPVDLPARDTATIGGMAATNAGGVHVLRHGPMRNQVLGAEAVLADGSVLGHLAGLLKDNTGYDWPQLLVGSEGTLGVITAVRLRLVPRQPERAVALVGVESTAAAVELAAEIRRLSDGLSAAEVFYEDGLDLVCRHVGSEPPLRARCPVYLLVEAVGRRSVVGDLAGALAAVGVDDAATALSDDEVGIARLWAYRERHSEVVSRIGVPHKLDVTVPVTALAEFERAVRRLVAEGWPGSTLVLFGHVLDGNLHVNVVGPPPEDESVDGAVLELVTSFGGSISAEHGVGRAKTSWLGLSRTPAELAAMAVMKDALDPEGILNPGVLFSETRRAQRRRPDRRVTR